MGLFGIMNKIGNPFTPGAGFFLLSLGVLLTGVVRALPVPEEQADGVSIRIEGFDPLPPKNAERYDPANLGAPEADATQPLKVSVTLENRGGKAVAGVLRTWMNDDWTLDGAAEERLSLAAGEKRTVTRTATAGERVLPALYPIHASFAFAATNLHPVAVFRAKTPNRAFRPRPRRIDGPGAYGLDGSRKRFVYVKSGDEERRLADPDLSDERTGGALRASAACWCGGERREGYGGHPPYREGNGTVSSAWGLDLPEIRPIVLRFAAGVSSANSDGVGIRVLVGAPHEAAQAVFSTHHRTTGKWVDYETDLSTFAGRRVVVWIAVDVGPAPCNSYNDSFSLSVPTLLVGERPKPVADPAAVRARAVANAKRGEYRLEGRGGRTYTAGVARGNQGLIDGAIAFTDGERTLVVDGFDCRIDGLPAGDCNGTALVRNRIWVEKGSLKVSWAMPDAKRGTDGSPRFTRIAAGPVDCAFTRVYAGMGNVVERPKKFTFSASGFTCSTRHVGADYENGLSLVQASDVFPDEVVCDSEKRLFALVTHNDATISFTPSNLGAFDAAFAFAAVSGYRRSSGFDNLAGKIVLDDWWGDYRRAAEGLPQSRRYGLEAVYLQHNWQRWGYDVRLPEVWPPRRDYAQFLAMARAAHEAGFPFGLHDNYIDLYPDTPGFTYDDIYFKADGLPHEAWYNPGPRILSYKWRPDAIWGWHAKNMKAMSDAAGVGALFIDVFTAAAPKDYYDRDGRFHAKDEQTAGWAAAFDRARTIFGKPDAIMVSEAGHDALIGHVDAGEADHFPVERNFKGAGYADGERVPWHDAVSHGKMVLLGGGLGSRYSGVDYKMPGADNDLHGYASHDYLCTTAIGGRGTMVDGPFSREGVFTWWLLGDIQKALAKGTFESFAFGRDIHEQHGVFSTGEVWVNRATNRCWTVNGHELPPYGLYARAGNCEAGIVRKDGLDVRFARAPGKWFVDARPPSSLSGTKYAGATVTGFEPKGVRDGELRVRWTVTDARAGEYNTFVHAIRHGETGHGKIVFQAGVAFADGKDALSRPGVRESTIRLRPPPELAPGEYDIRFGLFHKKTGERTPLLGWDDGTHRLFAGILTVAADGAVSWRPDEGTSRTRELGINVAHRPVDFGGIVTDGAFRLEAKDGSLVLTPLPGSLPFKARIDPKALGLRGDPIDFTCDATQFDYRIR